MLVFLLFYSVVPGSGLSAGGGTGSGSGVGAGSPNDGISHAVPSEFKTSGAVHVNGSFDGVGSGSGVGSGLSVGNTFLRKRNIV